MDDSKQADELRRHSGVGSGGHVVNGIGHIDQKKLTKVCVKVNSSCRGTENDVLSVRCN